MLFSKSPTADHANSCLFEFLQNQADEKQIQGVFRVASTAIGYGKMIKFATTLLQKFTQGLYGCTVGTACTVHDRHRTQSMFMLQLALP